MSLSLKIAFGNDLAIGLVHHEDTVHESDFGNTISELRFYVSIPKIFRFMHMCIGINDFHSLPHVELLCDEYKLDTRGYDDRVSIVEISDATQQALDPSLIQDDNINQVSF
jgi:hypothetical protein